MADPPGSRRDLFDQAAAWHARLAGTEGGAAPRAAFEQWRGAAEAHRSAYARVSAAAAQTRALGDRPAVLALRHETLTRLVMPRRRHWQPAALAASLAIAVVAGAIWRLPGDGRTAPSTATFERKIYQTGVGERLTIALPDGSIATLDTSSRLALAYTAGERRLVLEDGQAFFQVAKHQRRPFVVAAADRLVTAHGTTFDVRVDRSVVRVALLEGEVTVAPQRPDGDGAGTAMKPNEILVASGASTSVRTDDARQAATWRQGVVVFDNMRLDQALSEMNRYVTRPVVPGDAAIGSLRISGSFRTDAMPAFLEALEAGFGVRVVDRETKQVLMMSGGGDDKAPKP